MSIYQIRKLKQGEWIHLDYQDAKSQKSLVKKYGLDKSVAEILCSDDTRPRYFRQQQGFVFILRSANLNKGAEPDDMISLRVYVDDTNLITLSHRDLKAIAEQQNQPEEDTFSCFWGIVDRMANNIMDVALDISERTEDFEERVVDADKLQDFGMRSDLGELRRQIVSMRRYLNPQQKIFEEIMQNDAFPKATLREINNKLLHAVENLDYCNSHTMIFNEELTGKMSLSMNKIVYAISVFTLLLLPLNLLTSLLGINVGGIPLSTSEYGFAAVCIFLLLIFLVLLWVMKKVRWL